MDNQEQFEDRFIAPEDSTDQSPISSELNPLHSIELFPNRVFMVVPLRIAF
jgi:hypothetical protein